LKKAIAQSNHCDRPSCPEVKPGDRTPKSIDLLIHEWQESAQTIARPDLAAAFETEPAETPLTNAAIARESFPPERQMEQRSLGILGCNLVLNLSPMRSIEFSCKKEGAVGKMVEGSLCGKLL
jgi:hypothetical protein